MITFCNYNYKNVNLNRLKFFMNYNNKFSIIITYGIAHNMLIIAYDIAHYF